MKTKNVTIEPIEENPEPIFGENYHTGLLRVVGHAAEVFSPDDLVNALSKHLEGASESPSPEDEKLAHLLKESGAADVSVLDSAVGERVWIVTDPNGRDLWLGFPDDFKDKLGKDVDAIH